MSQPNAHFITIDEPFRTMANSMPVPIWIAGTDMRCYFFNQAWLRFTGRTMEQEQGNGWQEGVHPEDLDKCLRTYATAFQAREEFKMEYRLLRHDGTYRWIVDNGAPQFNADKAFTGYIGSCIDIDELLESERVKRDFISATSVEQQQTLNEELAAINEELNASNEEQSAINEALQQAQENLAKLNADLEKKVQLRTKALEESEAETQALNEELTVINEELNVANEELVTTNEELSISEANLQKSLQELTAAKDQIEKSERLFRSIALNIPGSLIMVITKDHHIITLEGDLISRMEFEVKDFAGRHTREIISKERYEAARPLYDRMLAGEKYSIEQRSPKGDDFMIHFVPMKDDHDAIYAGLIIALDITDFKVAERNSARLAAIIESSDDAIISKTLEGVITSWNQSAERTFGYKPEEIIGQSVLKLIPVDRQEEEPKILERLRRGERVEHFETKRITKDKKLLDLSLTISPIRDKQGNIIGLSKIARDISERKRDEQRKNDFIGMVSHELKTPLTTLTLLLQMLEFKLKHSDDPFVTEALEKGNIQVKRMNNLINGFLNISRLESAKIMMINEPFDLCKLVKETIDETAITTAIHKLKFHCSADVMVFADREKIGSVISNLLSNAIKYSPRGEVVATTIRVVEDKVVVSVKDNGIGIKPEDLPKVFERYYRIEGNDTRFISGFGIGLYLSLEIVNRQDGELWAESEFGKGSTFHFSLPVYHL